MTHDTVILGQDPEVMAIARNQGNGVDAPAKSAHLFPELEGFDIVRDDWGGSGSASLKTDGFAFELNCTPTYCRDWIVPHSAAVLRKFTRENPKYVLSAVPRRKLTKASLVNAPDDVTGYGCNPDRDAYKMKAKVPDPRGYLDDYRYTGAHIHVELRTRENDPYKGEVYFEEKDLGELRAAMVIALDRWLALPLVAMLGNTNDYGESARRYYYGQAGSYRETEYENGSYRATGSMVPGLEYRVLSSAIMLSPILYSWALGQFRQTIKRNFFSARDLVRSVQDGVSLRSLQDIINGHDVQAAREIVAPDIEYNRSHVPGEYYPYYMSKFMRLMLEADTKEIPLEVNMWKAWNLDRPIYNHHYLGVETLFEGDSNEEGLRIEDYKNAFPISSLIDGWDWPEQDYWDDEDYYEDDYEEDEDY